MKVALAVFCDFAQTPLGLPSRLNAVLGGVPVLHRTLRRAARIQGIDDRLVVCRAADAAVAARALSDAGLERSFELLPADPGVRPRAGLTRAARKWAIDSWRSNPLGLTWYDEFIDPTVVAELLAPRDDDAWLCIDGHQVALDVDIAGAMVQHARTRADEAPYVFTQAPPGISGLLLTRVAVEDLLNLACPFGLLLSYRPEIPVPDPITAGVCHAVAGDIAKTRARVLADTRRSCELLSEALGALGDDAAAGPLCAWLREPGHDRAGPLPVETEIELTTDDRLEHTTLRPRGERVSRRVLTDLSEVERIAAELGAYDDRLVVLGGHGDPLLHPRFADVCRLLRSAGVFGVAVVTPLVDLDARALEAIMSGDVDVLEVQLDAHSAETYRQVHGADFYERVVANIQRVEAARQERHSPAPVVVCSMTRVMATLPELEAFYDHWLTAGSAVALRGHSDFAGLLPPDPALPTCPPVRKPCARLGLRMALHADGRTPICDQDARGQSNLGSWTRQSLAEIWAGAAFGELRKRHADMDLAAVQPCTACREWHRV